MNNSENTRKKKWTEQERLELAAKLDRELDEFIENLPRKKYEDGWPEDRWEEEMAKHPFFMKEPPKPGDEVHPLFEGLQKLKYDPEENEPDDLAISYKEDGNFNFKYKNYRLAVLSYTEGIKVKCGNPEINATLLNNRAAAHFFLKNYRSSLQDCELALKIKPNYEKALVRAANCCVEMKNYKKAIDYCDIILNKEKDNRIVLDLRKKCVSAAKIKERDERKREHQEKKRNEEEDVIINEIIKRGYMIEGGTRGNLSLDKLEPHFPQLVHNRVHLDETGTLVWPVVFVYPEYKIMDYIQEFDENQTFSEQIEAMFKSPPDWDEQKKYIPNQLNIYFETSRNKIRLIEQTMTLGNVLKNNEYVIRGGTPSFIIMVKDSSAEKRFLEEY
ncbi:DNA polymerase interacting tetratricopeptide repeat-containing, protein of 47 kDa [Diorhabda carinulata]|uniref:DNA polymerase interacting tetratricopeptide repeat-containing, protein of 47 kDa n=1 Tax=Diorhabda carinulata TaxID=1163345 RepID=UPI0025A18FC5|nr:DNA polymerase interacting tetratricopeptide repeat-containing, protein of 47 kDa [Diorhabda carinulata]